MVHPTGNTYVRHDLQALHEAGLLWRFVTGLGFSRESFWGRLPGPSGWRQELSRRAYDLPGLLIQAHPWREATRLAAPRLGAPWLTRHETGWASVDAVFHALDRSAARLIEDLDRQHKPPRAVLTYEDGAEATLTAARRCGWTGVYHLPITYGRFARRLFLEEAQRLPEWAPTLQGDRDSPEKFARKERELDLADLVVCPSRFVLESLPETVRQAKPCHIVPYGAPSCPPLLHPDPRDAAPDRPLRLLFAGALSQRKGLADIFAALRLLGCPRDIELVLLGQPCAPWEFYRSQGVPFTYERPRANAAVLDLMARCDALVLPSIVEGRAIVQLEALSRGLPLLVTPNAGGEDLVTTGETGFLVPIRDPAALAEKISWLRDHRALLPGLREACRARANLVSWESYRRQLLAILSPSGENSRPASSP
ncbi:MAG: glycosyltransferase family 4 protein [Opitutales bacterium]